MYFYKAEYIKAHHGNLVTFLIDLGFKIKVKMDIMLIHVVVPESDLDIDCLTNYIDTKLSKATDIILETTAPYSKASNYFAKVIYDSIDLNHEVNCNLN